MLLITDVNYNDDDTATAAGIVFADWESGKATEQIVEQIVEHVGRVADYEPGSFYKRELPCLLQLIDRVNTKLDAVIVDGYVSLGAEQKPGLGMHLYEALYKKLNEKLHGRVPVLGIAKTWFKDTPQQCEVLRGKSRNPLYVTSAGMPLEEAKACVSRMHGANRLPTMVKLVDKLCRGKAPG